MMVWFQVWWIVLHGLFSQMVYPFPGPRPLVSIPLSGMLIWWEADLGSNCGGGACTDGANQDSWADQSGNGNNGTLTPSVTSCVAGVYHTNQINSKPAVTFNGNTTGGMGTCYSVGTTGTGLDNKATTTEFLVLKNNGAGRAYSSGLANSIAYYGYGTNAGSQQLLQQGSTAGIGNGTAVGDTSFHQLNVTYNSSTGAYAFRRDRATDGSGTNAKSITGNWLLLGETSSGGNILTLDGQIAAFIMYNRVLSGAEITTVETYLNGKYGL